VDHLSKTDTVLKAINELFKSGMKLLTSDSRKDDLKLRLDYEQWYTESLAVVTQITPERLNDFHDAYKIDKRKEINAETYTISDYMMGLSVSRLGEPLFNAASVFQSKLLSQLAILRSAAHVAPSVLRDIQTVIRAEVLDSDIDAAKELAKAKHLRSAGVVCGVVIEAHLKSVASRHAIRFRKKRLTISDLNDALKSAKVYDVPTWRLIQRLGDIRNLCGHSSERDPTKEEVQDLIAGTEKIIKEVV
jgi:hypothetical protein